MARYLLTLAALSTAAWASPASIPWTQLNQSVDGRLYQGRSYAAPCYSTYEGQPSTPNATLCQQVIDNRRNAYYLDEQFGTVLTSNFAQCEATGAACPVPFSPSASGSCSQGAVAPYYVDVRQVSDVQHALAFASKYKVPLSVKNTGHDYKGRSAGATLSVWTHHLQPNMTFSPSLQLDGCGQVANAITMGAGQQLIGLYDFAHANGRDVVGGADPTVGVAGWVSGGGHSALSPSYGLGVDQMVQIRGVLANGTAFTANKCQNPDLFFALRGGGGATFAVMTEMTMLTVDPKPLQFATFPRVQLNQTQLRQFWTVLAANADTWAQQGWGGFFNITTDLRGEILFLVTPRLTLDEAKASLQPLSAFYASLPTAPQGQVFTLPSFRDAFSLIAPGGKSSQWIGNSASLSSRLLPSRYFAPPLRASLVDALVNTTNNAVAAPDAQDQSFLIGMVTPKYANISASASPSSAVTPAWRDSYWHFILTNEWLQGETDPGFVRDKFRSVHEEIEPLRALTAADGGAYVNEADTFEPNHEFSFWGANYARLLRIKKDVDPGNVLTNHQAVGWSGADARYACYPKIKA